MSFEQGYNHLVNDIIAAGDMRQTRAGMAHSIFGMSFTINSLRKGEFPLLTQRRIFYPGVFGELAAFVRGAVTVADFKKWGCNYWDANARAWSGNNGRGDDDLEVGQIYGAQWRNWEQAGYNQLDALINGLKTDPHGRRHVLTTYSPTAISCLPPCHLIAQYYVDKYNYLDCQVYMRSLDMILGLPSDIALYAALLVALAHEVDKKPGTLTMIAGDAHVYEQHVNTWFTQQNSNSARKLPTFEYVGSTVQAFEPEHLVIKDYNHSGVVKYAFNV